MRRDMAVGANWFKDFLMKGIKMPKEEWGVKRICPTTGKRFYDLNKDPIVSPYTGEVVELGSAIKDIKVGDHVSFQFSPSCGRCRRCLEGRPQVCELAAATKGKGELMSGGSRLSDLDGNVLNHHTGISCMSQYSVVDRGSVVVIDKSINIQDAALFGCAVMTGVGAVINTARIRPGDTVAIIGY